MHYNELTTRVVKAGLGVVTSPEEDADDADTSGAPEPPDTKASDPAGAARLVGGPGSLGPAQVARVPDSQPGH